MIKPNIFVILPIISETYSYTTTLIKKTGLPIFYIKNNVFDERLLNISNKYYFNDDNDMIDKYMICLKDIINKGDKEYINIDEQPKIYIPEEYYNIFKQNNKHEYINNKIYDMKIFDEKYLKNKSKYEDIHKKINPYAIYFPQFHEVKENNINFYEGYTDILNLQRAKIVDNTLETPLNILFENYDLKYNETIINKQILLAKSYGFCGFGIYYYWFSENNITNENMIFKHVIDNFFNDNLNDFNVFFIYANENWTNNACFSNNEKKYTIINEYTSENIKKNIFNLIPYFKHKNYKKINNKPLFFIHHPYELKDNEIDLFFNIANEILILNGFDGIELIINSIAKKYDKYINYNHHCNYKVNQSSFTKIIDNFRYIDYQKYIYSYVINNINDNNENINTIFTNFNNSPRFFYHQKKNLYITKTINNSIDLFEKFLNIQFKKYFGNKNEISKIFLVNAWNEWGEQMVLEPSNEKGFIYLKKFKNMLIKYFK